MSDAKRILIVEDDEDIASALSRGLKREGYAPELVTNVDDAIAASAAARMDAAIVDMMLGDALGSDLVRALRAQGMGMPIIILSAMSGVEDRASGLESGADDYVVKPFVFSELLARLRVQEKRRTTQPDRIVFQGLEYLQPLRVMRAGNQQVQLTETEGKLMEMFLQNPNRVLGRHDLFVKLWADEGGKSENVVDVYVGYLRRKLRPMADIRIGIVTIRGRGFMLTEEHNAPH